MRYMLHVTGKISNFKLYNVALEPSEVQKFYNLGRTGRSMVISDTAVGIGKVPEAQLDVRGVARMENLSLRGILTVGGLIDEAELYYDPTRAECQDGAFFATGANTTINGLEGNSSGDYMDLLWTVITIFGSIPGSYTSSLDRCQSHTGNVDPVDCVLDYGDMVRIRDAQPSPLGKYLGHGQVASNKGYACGYEV